MSSVTAQLKRGGWKTSAELVRETGRTFAEVMDELFSPTNRGKFLNVNVPTREPKVIYHRTTPETRSTANRQKAVDLMDLPWALKCSAAKKVDAMHRARVIGSGLPESVRAVLLIEKRLIRVGLYKLRCRPRDGFLYRCSWRVNYPPNPTNLERHLLGIDFNGAVNTKTSVPKGNVVHPDTNDLRRWITLRHDQATMVLSGIARVSLKAGTLEFMHVPSRKSIIASTKEMLLDAAGKERRAAMFMPLEPAEFALLSTSEPREEEKLSCPPREHNEAEKRKMLIAPEKFTLVSARETQGAKYG